jgi:arylsulfate sulfotransferase
MSTLLRLSILAGGFAALAAAQAETISVTVTPSAISPMPVGTMVTFSAAVSGANGNNLWYRFRVRRQGREYRIIRDYGPANTLDWTASDREGLYEMEVSARDLDSGSEASATALFQFESRVMRGTPVISPTANSLVFLYSAPPCAAGSRMRVQFQAAGGTPQSTPYKPCTPGFSMNIYLAGMLANTAYTAQYVLDTGFAFMSGPAVNFTTGGLPPKLYSDAVVVPSQNPVSDPILLGSPQNASPVANDLAGNVLWYGPADVSFLTRAEPGGEFWGVVETQFDQSQQVVRKFDLTGMTLLETNAARVNEQLAALGKRPIGCFHHEARTIAQGRIAVLATVEQILTDVQGPGPVDVVGDVIVVLDQNLNVVWTWDAFDNLDTSRKAVLAETCPQAGCAELYLAQSGNDWTHGNALQETSDGNILYSTRNQDWLIKISYDGGTGDGHILWRMGVAGDFQINSSDPYPWFSHQHDANFEIGDATMLLVFDDGNTRVAQQGGNSRGQVLQVDERNRAVTPVLNADLGVYAGAVGSAQQLKDGDYHFDAGFVVESNNAVDSYSFEIDANNKIRYEAHQNVVLYRTFRMTDMYTPN